MMIKIISFPAFSLFSEDGNSMFFRIAGTYLPSYTVSYPKRKQPSVVKIFVKKVSIYFCEQYAALQTRAEPGSWA